MEKRRRMRREARRPYEVGKVVEAFILLGFFAVFSFFPSFSSGPDLADCVKIPVSAYGIQTSQGQLFTYLSPSPQGAPSPQKPIGRKRLKIS